MGKAGEGPSACWEAGLHNADVIKGVRINKHGSMSSSSSSDH